MNMKKLTEQVKQSKELLAALGAVIAIVIGGYWWLQDSIRDRELAVVEKYSEILNDRFVNTAVAKIDSLTAANMRAAVDTILYVEAVNRYADSLMHLRTLRRTDEIVIRVDRLLEADRHLDERIDALAKMLKELRGIAELSREEAEMRALTDSLQNELILVRQQQNNRMRMRQMEQQHLKEMKEIRDLSKDVVIDRGRKKRIRTKPLMDKPGYEFPL